MATTSESWFDKLSVCPGCAAARKLTTSGLCATCDRLQRAGRLIIQPDYDTSQETNLVLDTFTTAPLFKRASDGSIQVWNVRAEPAEFNTAVVVVSYGQLDGKLCVKQKTIKTGKNTGRKNATTPFEQAVLEAQSKWNEKRDRDYYGLTVEESDEKRLYAPMLAQSWLDDKRQLTNYAKSVNWDDIDCLWGQPKFDGNRCRSLRLHNTVEMRSKGSEFIDTCDHIVEQLFDVIPPGVCLDGELYIHGVPVTTLRGLIAKKQPGTEHLCFVVYDHVDKVNGYSIRKQYLESLLPKFGTHIHLAKTVPIRNPDELMAFQRECILNGYEGAMLRHGREGYRTDERVGSLLKVKTFTDKEFEIVGCHQGEGSFEGAAIFECVTEEGYPFDVTAPGTIPQKQWYYQHWQEFVGKMITVKYPNLTATDRPVPFQPVAKEILS